MATEDLLTWSAFFVGGSLLTSGSMALAWRKQFVGKIAEFQDQLNSNRQKFAQERSSLTADYLSNKARLEKHLSQINQEKIRVESELAVFHALEKELILTDSEHQACEVFSNCVQSALADECIACAVVSAAPFNAVITCPEYALAPLELVQKSDSWSLDIFEHGAPRVVDPMGIDQLHKVCPDVQYVLILPVVCRDQRLARVCILWNGRTYAERLQLIKRMVEHLSASLFRIAQYDQEVRASRIDLLTGLPNSKYLYEVFPQLIERASADSPLSMLLIETDNTAEINEQYGYLVGDVLMGEFVSLLKHNGRVEELTSESNVKDHYIRYGGTQFALLLENTDAVQASIVAERIRAAVAAKDDWYGGVPNWSVSIGSLTCPFDGDEPKGLRARAEVALMYVKERLGSNNTVRFDQVPRAFRVSKLSAKLDGSLDVFEPSVVLQSVAGNNSNKTGILAVSEPDGNQFWVFIEGGKLKKAYLKGFRGDQAVVEFLTTFEEGTFKFREYSTMDKDLLEEIHRLNETFDVKKALEKNLLDGALAQDLLASAQRQIPSARLFVRQDKRAQEIIKELAAGKDPPTEQEIEVMQAILKCSNGRTMLDTIMEKLDVPTYLRWHASAILIKSKAIELTRLGLSFSL